MKRHPVTCTILVGGASSRLGRNKAFLPLRGRSLLETQLVVLRPLFDRIVIGARDPLPYAGFGLPVARDLLSERCALTGIHAALSAAVTPYVFVVACDLPHLSPGLIEDLLQRRVGVDAVVPHSRQGPEPLHAVYSRSCLPAIQKAAEDGLWGTATFLSQVQVARPLMINTAPSPFFNLNTPDDFNGLAG